MLAVVIPYYKITFFNETLQSLSNQTNKNFKVYIGDDASPDNCEEILKNFQVKFNFEYKRFENNLGGTSLTQQWERCIALSSGAEWIMILGDDDVLGDNVVEEFYNNYSKFEDEFNVIRFSTIKINGNSDIVSDKYLNPTIEKATDFLFRETRSSLSEYIFKKDKLLNVGFKNFPLAWHSDILAVIEVADFENIYSINEALIQIRISKESISGSSDNMNKKLLATFRFYYYLLQYKNALFTENQNQILLQKLKKSYFQRKKSIINFSKISCIYLKYFSIIEYLDFLKLFLFKIIK